MERLKNKEILVGREPGQGRLMISVNINGQHKATALGEFKSVPDGVSRCKPAEGTAHCKIAFDANGSITVTNLKPANCTYVDNRGITTKSGVKTNAQLQLGTDKYPVAMGAIVEAAKKLLPAPEKVYSIKHLEKVYEEYEAAIEAIQIGQQKRSKMSMLPIMISMGIGLFSSVLGQYVNRNSWFGWVLAVLPLLFYLKNFTRRDTSIEDRKAATNKLIDNYVCPNPDCHHYVGAQPYKVLRQNHNCPYCKCKWTED